MLKIRIKADLRCPEGHRVRGGNFRASCAWCVTIYAPGGITTLADALRRAIADYEQQYPEKEKEADNEKD